jgi:AraC-like DNA-binding protein
MNATEVDDAHIHPCHEIYVNVSGDIAFLHDSTVYDIRHADVIVSHPGDVHYCIYRSSCEHEHFCLWFRSEEIGAFLERRGIRGRIRPDPSDAERLVHLAYSLNDRSRDPFIRAAELMELLTILDTDAAREDGKAEEPPAKLGEMLGYIDTHLLSVSGADELSRVFFISESTINRTFKRHIGIPVGKLIEAKRLSLAEKLLRADLSVTDVCYRAGFTDCSRFIACFKQKFGKTPLKYKQELFRRKSAQTD